MAKKKDEPSGRIIRIQLTDDEYTRLLRVYGPQGLHLHRAGKLALFYAAEQIEAGHLGIALKDGLSIAPIKPAGLAKIEEQIYRDIAAIHKDIRDLQGFWAVVSVGKS
jgi:hypothetical protein